MADWDTRSKGYNGLQWVQSLGYAEHIVDLLDLAPGQTVLDVGTGTGVMLNMIAPKVKKVIGIDTSRAMLKKNGWIENKYFIEWDARERLFASGLFDRILMRLVLHHITDGALRVLKECRRILAYGGKMVLSEGVPPCHEVKQDYIDIFKLKENRLTFMPLDLRNLMLDAGFKDVAQYVYKMEAVSVKNWLEKSGIPQENQNKIYDMHVNGSDIFKRAYNMKITENDCLIDMKFHSVVGHGI